MNLWFIHLCTRPVISGESSWVTRSSMFFDISREPPSLPPRPWFCCTYVYIFIPYPSVACLTPVLVYLMVLVKDKTVVCFCTILVIHENHLIDLRCGACPRCFVVSIKHVRTNQSRQNIKRSKLACYKSICMTSTLNQVWRIGADLWLTTE